MGEEDNSPSQHVTIPPPKIDKLSEKERIEIQKREEDENIDRNIDDIGRKGDLSPRKINHLKGKSKKGTSLLIYCSIRVVSKSFRIRNIQKKTGMLNAKVNYATKIWIFWEEDWDEHDVVDSVQQVTIRFKRRGLNDYFRITRITAVYARRSALERLELWEKLEEIAGNSTIPWLVGGDFNTMMDESEKLGGLPVTQMEIADFVQL
ncbi:hypothetical protein KY285_037453 [Solanum tuberosum]|nr:hypothetical protein KY289_037696 [Solanum tuberosum]KAH0640867.1 hypothetical protein KY285_037453 [Solanum tuberosum]